MIEELLVATLMEDLLVIIPSDPLSDPTKLVLSQGHNQQILSQAYNQQILSQGHNQEILSQVYSQQILYQGHNQQILSQTQPNDHFSKK